MFSCQTDHYLLSRKAASPLFSLYTVHCQGLKFSSRWHGSNSCTLMSTCKYISANFKLTNMLELIQAYILTDFWNDNCYHWVGWLAYSSTHFQVFPTRYWTHLYSYLEKESTKKCLLCIFPQLSINLNGKTLMMALFMVKHILRWGQWTIFRNLWFGFSRNRILSNVRTQIMNPAKAQTRIAWLLSNMLITMQVLLPNISKDWLYFKTLWVIFKSTYLCSNILKGSWTY